MTGEAEATILVVEPVTIAVPLAQFPAVNADPPMLPVVPDSGIAGVVDIYQLVPSQQAFTGILTIACIAFATLPPVAVVHTLFGISIMHPAVVEVKLEGAVIVVIVPVPPTWTTGVSGAIVAVDPVAVKAEAVC